MNYMQEVKAFNDYLETHELSTGQIALWYALMDIFNRCYWPNYITISSYSLKVRTKLSPNGLRKAREGLIEAGLIQVFTRNTKSPTYSINSIAEKKNVMYTTISHSAQTSAKCDLNSAQVTSHSAQVEAEKAHNIKVRKYPKTYITKTYKTYNNKKGSYKDYTQREYDDKVLELYYCN